MSSNEQNNPNPSTPSPPNPISGAITFPARNEENVQPAPVQPRQPSNLQGLLRFAMEATKAEDAAGHSELSPMDQDRRLFLEEALRNLTVDMAQVLRDSIQTLSKSDYIKNIPANHQHLPADVKLATDNLLELVDDMDVANDFQKMGGFAIFPICLASQNPGMRAVACTILGECCQNNPYCQQKALETGLVDVVVKLMETESGEELAKCIYAVSCCCRACPAACAALAARGGCARLAALLTHTDLQVRTKAAFLVRHLCRNRNCTEAREAILNEDIISIITNQIKNGQDSSTEHLLSIIVALLETGNQSVIQKCREVSLKNVLKEHLKQPELVSDQFREEKEYSEEILKKLKAAEDSDSIDFNVDR